MGCSSINEVKKKEEQQKNYNKESNISKPPESENEPSESEKKMNY